MCYGDSNGTANSSVVSMAGDDKKASVTIDVDGDNDTIVTRRKGTNARSGSVKSQLRNLRKKVKALVEAYTAVGSFARHEQLDRVRRELEELIERKSKASPREIYRHAERLERCGRGAEAILFYQISASHSRRHAVPEKALELTADCVSRMLGTALEFDESEHWHIVAIMHELLRQIRDAAQEREAEREAVAVAEARALRVIATFQGVLGALKQEEESVKQALYAMETSLGSVQRCSRYKTYSGCLFSLGTAYRNQHRYREASLAFQQAIEADKMARDYEHEQQRKQSIVLTREIKDEMQRKWMVAGGKENNYHV